MRSRNIRLVAISLALFSFPFMSGCKKKPAPVASPPPPPAAAVAARPTATISVNPASIERGQSATLEWRTTDPFERGREIVGDRPVDLADEA